MEIQVSLVPMDSAWTAFQALMGYQDLQAERVPLVMSSMPFRGLLDHLALLELTGIRDFLALLENQEFQVRQMYACVNIYCTKQYLQY